MTFHTRLKNLSTLFDLVARKDAFHATSADEFFLWRNRLRATLAGLIGLDWTSGLPVPVAEAAGVEQMDGYTRTKFYIETELSVIMPVFMLKPDGLKHGKKTPVMICCHGHNSHGKDAVVGNVINEEHAKIIKDHNYDYGVQFVKQGFLVFAPDADGMGERRTDWAQNTGSELYCSCAQINNRLLPLGKTVTGVWLSDLMRLVDFITARDDAATDKIGVAGLSGGGLQALWLGAFDDRVRVVIDSGYFYGVKQSLLEMPCCSCSYVPRLFEHVDMGDLGAMCAPKAFFIETGDQDHLNGRDNLANVLPQVETTRAAYKLMGHEEKIRHHIFNGPHLWDGKESIPFAITHLMR